MECKDALEKMNAWMDGELPEKEAEMLKYHIDGCSNCRMAARNLLEVVQAFDRFVPGMPGPELEARTLDRFEMEVETGENRTRWRNHVFDEEGLIDLLYPL